MRCIQTFINLFTLKEVCAQHISTIKAQGEACHEARNSSDSKSQLRRTAGAPASLPRQALTACLCPWLRSAPMPSCSWLVRPSRA